MMSVLLLEIPRVQNALFKALIESYDNLITLRTEDPGRNHLKLAFSPESADDVQALIDSIAGQFSIRILPAE